MVAADRLPNTELRTLHTALSVALRDAETRINDMHHLADATYRELTADERGSIRELEQERRKYKRSLGNIASLLNK